MKGREGKDSPYLKVKGPAAEREKERETSFSLSFDSSADFVFVHYGTEARLCESVAKHVHMICKMAQTIGLDYFVAFGVL